MISFRQLVVMLVSIFLALGLGILAGTTIIDQSLVKTLRDETHAAEKTSKALKRQRDASSELVKLMVPHLVNGRLAHRPVILVTDANVDSAALGQVTGYLGQAKADVVAQLQTTDSLAPGSPASGTLNQVLAAAGIPVTGDLSSTTARALADRLASGPPAVDPKTGKEVSHDLLNDLLSHGFLSFPTTSPPTPKDIGGPGQAVVVVTGGSRDPAVPLQSFMQPFVEQLVSQAVPTEVGEPRATTHSFVGLLRHDNSLGTAPAFATMDDLSGTDPRGGLALILALRDILRPQPRGGNYGVKQGASGGLIPS